MRQSIVLLGFLALLSSCASHASMTTLEKLPNILWIYTEDLSPFMGCYGHE